jgi:hypothetical protein
MNICDYGCGQEAKYKFKNGKWCCSEKWQNCPAKKKQITEYLINYNKKNNIKKSNTCNCSENNNCNNCKDNNKKQFDKNNHIVDTERVYRVLNYTKKTDNKDKTENKIFNNVVIPKSKIKETKEKKEWYIIKLLKKIFTKLCRKVLGFSRRDIRQ